MCGSFHTATLSQKIFISNNQLILTFMATKKDETTGVVTENTNEDFAAKVALLEAALAAERKKNVDAEIVVNDLQLKLEVKEVQEKTGFPTYDINGVMVQAKASKFIAEGKEYCTAELVKTDEGRQWIKDYMARKKGKQSIFVEVQNIVEAANTGFVVTQGGNTPKTTEVKQAA